MRPGKGIRTAVTVRASQSRSKRALFTPGSFTASLQRVQTTAFPIGVQVPPVRHERARAGVLASWSPRWEYPRPICGVR